MSISTLRERRHHTTGDQGLTLIELLIVLVIMPVIIGAIAFGLVSVFQLQSSTSQRLSGSVDLQKVSSQFTRDVQDSEHVYLGVTPQQCGTVGTQLLGLGWNYGNGSDQTMVSYVRVAMRNNSSNYLLERLYCTLGNMTTPSATTVLSADFYVSSGLLVQNPPSVCVSNLQSCVTNTSTSYNSHDIAAVTFTMYVPMSSSAYTMVVSPRGGTSPDTGSANGGPTAGITLLGTCTGGANTVLTVGNGDLNIQTLGNGQGTGSLGLVNCPASAVTLANNGSIDASGVLTGQQSTTGISVGANPGTYPTQVTTDSGLCNWLQSTPNGCSTISNPLVVPTTWDNTTKCGGGNPQPACGSCVPTVGANNQYTYTCTSGVYPVTPSFQNGAIIDLTGTSDGTSAGIPGVTLFQSDFTVPNGGTLNLAPGESYVFAAPDAGAFSTGTSNKKNNGIDISGTNVLLYVPTGGMTFSNNTLVQLTGSSSNDYVDLWLNGNNVASGDGVLTLGNNSTSTATDTYGGIYVPYGEVVDSNNGTISASFILAGSASFSNGLTVTITGY